MLNLLTVLDGYRWVYVTMDGGFFADENLTERRQGAGRQFS
jgi:hypothetical protein